MLLQALASRQQKGNYRTLEIKESLVDFASNDYLGLARSPILKEKILAEWSEWEGFGSTGSRLLTGHHAYVEALERHIAAFHGYETGLIFNCGYMANLSLGSTIGKEKDVFLYDAAIHASLYEGIRRSAAQAFPFRHNDLSHLEWRLKRLRCSGNLYICIESLYSTDGSLAPLRGIAELAKLYNAKLIVDEAHAIGIMGKEGKGLVFDEGLQEVIFAQVVTFGKALGAFGAIVLGNAFLKEVLINFASPFIYTTALPFPCLAAIKSSYDLFPHLEKERKRLQEYAKMANFSCTPLQPIPVKDIPSALALVAVLREEGYDLRVLRSPTVQKGKEILRLTLHAFNTKEEVECVLNLLRKHG